MGLRVTIQAFYVCGVRLASVRSVERILFIFGVQEFIHYRSLLGESKHSSSKNVSPSCWSPKSQNNEFLGNCSNDFDWCLGTVSLNKTAWALSSGTCWGAQRCNASLLEIDFIDHTDCIFVRDSAAKKKGLSSKVRFRCHSNELKVNRIWEFLQRLCTYIPPAPRSRERLNFSTLLNRWYLS